jgi:hypothetical protein
MALNGINWQEMADGAFIVRADSGTRWMMQGEFNFDATGAEEGYTRWLAGRKLAAAELARRMNLPLGHPVEVWLAGGVRLRGALRLQEDLLLIEEDHIRHLKLVVEGVAFSLREMESCVRLD